MDFRNRSSHCNHHLFKLAMISGHKQHTIVRFTLKAHARDQRDPPGLLCTVSWISCMCISSSGMEVGSPLPSAQFFGPDEGLIFCFTARPAAPSFGWLLVPTTDCSGESCPGLPPRECDHTLPEILEGGSRGLGGRAPSGLAGLRSTGAAWAATGRGWRDAQVEAEAPAAAAAAAAAREV
jgi:hypothetical protein